MFAVIVQLYGSAPWREKAKKLGMCVKGSGGSTGTFDGGLSFITVPTLSNSTNQTGNWALSPITGFAGASSFSNFDALQNPFSLHSD